MLKPIIFKKSQRLTSLVSQGRKLCNKNPSLELEDLEGQIVTKMGQVEFQTWNAKSIKSRTWFNAFGQVKGELLPFYFKTWDSKS